MFKHSKNSDQINPWTFRHRQTSGEFNQSSTAAIKPIKSLRQKLNLNKKYMYNHSHPHRKNMTDLYFDEVIHEQQSRVYCANIPKHSLEYEALTNIQKIIPSYKFISFQYRSRPMKRSGKAKKQSPQVTNSMRQYTEGLQITHKKEEKPSSQYEKILKVRRYFTEEKDYQDYNGKKFVGRSDLTQMSKTQQVRKPFQHAIKIVKTCKNNSREEVVTKGKLFQKIQNICDRKGISGGGHLSTMKRNYNIKKLQKLLNHDDLSKDK